MGNRKEMRGGRQTLPNMKEKMSWTGSSARVLDRKYWKMAPQWRLLSQTKTCVVVFCEEVAVGRVLLCNTQQLHIPEWFRRCRFLAHWHCEKIRPADSDFVTRPAGTMVHQSNAG